MLDALRRWWSGGQRPTGPVLVQPAPDPALDVLGAASLPPQARVAALVRDVLAEMEQQDGIPDTRAARVMLVAISGQEAAWTHRDQVVVGKLPGAIGPATGLWQFERGGGVAGVLRHPASAPIAWRWCRQARIPGLTPSPDAVWRRLVTDDRLACALARLLLLTDPRPLPTEMQEGWDYYRRNWRPGRPHPATWPARWDAARRVV